MAVHVGVENFFDTTITAGTIGATGDFTMTLASAPSSQTGFLVISPENANLREVVFFHSVSGNDVSVRGENRFSPKAHSTGETIKMNDVSQLFDYVFNNISDAFYIEKTGGLNIKVYGGRVFYNGNSQTVADTNLALTDNATNYIKYTYSTNTIANSASDGSDTKAVVTTLSGAITNIVYRPHKESYMDASISITDALPDQTGNADKLLKTDGTNPSWGYAGLRQGLGSTTGVPKISAAGVETILQGTEGQFVRFGTGGVPEAATPTTDINGLSETTTPLYTDTYMVYSGGSNKKVKAKNIQPLQTLGTLTSTSSGSGTSYVYGTSRYSDRGTISYSLSTTTLGSTGSGISPHAKVQYSRDNSTWYDLVDVTCNFFNQSASQAGVWGYVDGGIYVRSAAIAESGYATASASVTITT